MTFSWPSFLAAATSAVMPPPAETELAVAQLVPPLVLLPLALLEPEELQPTVSSRLPATAAPAARACLARKIFPPKPQSPRSGDQDCRILARQVGIMASQHKREVASPWRASVRWRSA